jgi:hypothetical protein
MILKVHSLIILLLMLALGRAINAQSLTQSQNGTITVRVACNCELVTDKSNQPLRFMISGKCQRDAKHLKIMSNCTWNLRVVTNKSGYESIEWKDENKDQQKENKLNKKLNNDKKKCLKPDNFQITYSFKNFRGNGKLLNPYVKYVLGSSPQNLPTGMGELEFDVIFELEGDDLKHFNQEDDNTWVSFYVLPKE